MQNHVISLTTEIKRREHIQNEFGKKGVNFKFFDALTPEPAKALVKKMGLAYNENYMTGGELACFMSHVSLWQKMIDEDIAFMGIFEDDIYLGEHADQFLNSSNWLKDEWDIVKLEVTQNKIITDKSSIIELNCNRQLKKLIFSHLGSGGYAISKQGAKKLLNYCLNVNPLPPIDHILFKNLVNTDGFNTLQMIPALCIQDIILNNGDSQAIFKSTLIRERGVRMNKEQHSFSSKIKREYLRLLSQIKFLMLARRIHFK